MKRNLLLSFLVLLALFFVMRWQGHALITPQSPRGILDLELAKTHERFLALQLFWDPVAVRTNLYLDFLLIAAYAWFFISGCRYVLHKTKWKRWTARMTTISIAAACFDIAENFLLLLILTGRFSTDVLQVVYYCAILKFLLAAIVAVYLLTALPIAFFLKRKARQNQAAGAD
ncbi:MAG TPA: hypothetical protein VHK91_02260 [Flavisolibacter sp.]|jgi:hypothetical protein|nr:hypothetical protein [Flavisolibacter sp.]